ncbi:hypothetical protein ACFGOO_06380 [Treponema vincentii]|uniref:hypothetical protein n=1 Tax=Treponema vincentii TaxID=69710 RepID=UPI0035F59715
MTDMNETNNTEKLEDQGDFESVNHQPLQAPVGTDTAPRSQPAAQQAHDSMLEKIKAFFAEKFESLKQYIESLLSKNKDDLLERIGETDAAVQKSATELKGHVDGAVQALAATQKKLADDTFNALNDTFHSLENSINDPENGITAQLVQRAKVQLSEIQGRFNALQEHAERAAQWTINDVNTHTDEAVKGVNGHIDNTVRRATDEVRDHVTAVVDKQTQQLQTNLTSAADQRIQHLQQELHNKIDATSKEETELIREAMGTIKTEIGKIGQGMQAIYNGIIQNAAKSQAESNQKLDLSNQKLDTILTVLTQQLENFKAEVQRLEGEKSHLTQERDKAREQAMQLSSELGKKKEQIADLTLQYNTSEKECTEQKRITEPYASFTPDYKNLLALTLQCDSLHELLDGITNPENTEDMLKFLLIFGSEQSFALKVYTVMREYKKLHKEPLSDAERTLVSAINSFYRQNRQLEFDVFEIAESVDGVIKFDKNKMQDMERPADTVMRGVEVIYVPTLRRDAAAIAFKAIVKGIK